jgi:WD40 repeat protein
LVLLLYCLWFTESSETSSGIAPGDPLMVSSPNGECVLQRTFHRFSLGFARVWDTATWEEQATLEGFLNAVFSVSFSPNGRRLATGGANPNDALKLWDVDGWQEVLTLKVEEGQGSLFISNAFSPDGNTVGTMSEDGFLHLWPAPSWEAIDTAEAREKAGGAQP